MSRSDRMPSIRAPSAETTKAPIRSVCRRWSASSSGAPGAMVLTSRPLRARMYSTFIGRSSPLRPGPGLPLELAQGVAHPLEHGLLAAGHVLALGRRRPPALQDRVLLVRGEVPVRQHRLRLAEHGTRIVQRLLVPGHDHASPARAAGIAAALSLLENAPPLVELGLVD